MPSTKLRSKPAAAPAVRFDVAERSWPGSRFNRGRVAAPPTGIGQPPAGSRVETVTVAVADPFGPGRHLAAANRRIDILELERSHGRISEAAYRVGRLCQQVFERDSSPGASSTWRGGRVSSQLDTGDTAVRGLETAGKVVALLRSIEKVVGIPGAKLLRRLLTGEVTYAGEATARGRPGERGTSATADRLRWMLEDLSEAWAAKGRERERKPE